MATYNSQIARTDAQTLMPEEVTREIFQSVTEDSTVMRLATKLPMMQRKQMRMPVLGNLPVAYFVNPSDTGLKQTTQASWKNKFINAEEIAVLMPIPEAVLDDADYDIWTEVKPRISEAFGLLFDQAVYYGTSAPTSWPTCLLTGATNASKLIHLSAYTDMFDAFMKKGGLLNLIERDGYNASGFVGAQEVKADLRSMRSSTGVPIFVESMQNSVQSYSIGGAPAYFPVNGAVDPTQSLVISGDWKQLVYSMRQDLTYKVLDQAVIQDGSGAIIFNLAQQDMVALRVVMRLGWEIPNPPTRLNTNDTTRYPFSVLAA